MSDPIHVIPEAPKFGAPVTTLCGLTGNKVIGGLRSPVPYYDGRKGQFRAILANDTRLGATCGLCKRAAAARRKPAERLNLIGK